MAGVSKIDKAILTTDKVICDNIENFGRIERGLLSQNILGQVRNFVEYVVMKACLNDEVNPNCYDSNIEALKALKKRGDLNFLRKFHELLQKSVSHYTVDKDGSERLMLKYYEYFLKIKWFLEKKYKLEVLKNIDSFPINMDAELSSYYKKIAEKIEKPSVFARNVRYDERYYIQKVKPFFVDQGIYYEVTFTEAVANVSKFGRVIAFTRLEIMDNYAVMFSVHKDIIRVLDKDMDVLIIDNYEVSIRPCEWDNLSEIFGDNIKCSAGAIEYRSLMKFISERRLSLTELVSSEQCYYDMVKKQILENAKSVKIYYLLDQCREVIIGGKHGANVLRYLLHKMNNRTIKLQSAKDRCEKLSNLYLSYSCIPFDKMPYCTSLCQHNPKIYDLLESIPDCGREQELLARHIKNNTEIEGHIFTDKADIETFKNIDELILKYNNALYYKHTGRMLQEYKGHIYIKEYVENSGAIINRLLELSKSGVRQYKESVSSWLIRESYSIDDEDKKDVLLKMFTDSHVAMIYGSAGTGKSTLINHIANFWAKNDKLFLANTYPAVDNMKRKVTARNSEYKTIAKFLSSKNCDAKCDILFIDECSTVSNTDMRQVLEKAEFKLLVLVGDEYQIESIYFGNWFSIAQKFIPKTAVFELTHPYRTSNKELLMVWERVRNCDDAMLEALVKNGHVAKLDESIFEHSSDDEIILCLNYDGVYGINNINRFLQNSNPSKAVVWGINTYKIGDPILFNEINRFSPLIHNNSKGRIVGIKKEEKQIWFDIELDESINEIDALDYEFQLIDVSDSGKSIISFSVNKLRSTDEDDDYYNSSIVPFQVAYAVSIHKAQGLEYDSVKVVITNEVEERITHNIFYTAITRAKNKLKIYWSPETEKYVLEHLKIKNFDKDACLLSNLSSISMLK